MRPEISLRGTGPASDDAELPVNEGIVQKGFLDGREGIWRYADEPGTWRRFSGAFVPMSELPSYGVNPAELDARRTLDDKEKVRQLIAAAAKKTDIIEQRQGYQLVSNGAGWQVMTEDGTALTPGPVSEATAREVLMLLAPDLAPEQTLAEALS